MHIPPIVLECFERPDIQEKLFSINTPEQKAALAEEVHGLLPPAIGIVLKQEFIADVLDEPALARYRGAA